MDDIYTTLQPLFVFSNLLGFFPVTFKREKKGGNFETSFFDVVITLIALGILTYCLVISFILCVKYVETDQNLFMSKIWTFILIFGICSVFISFIYQIQKLRQIESFYELINKCDSNFRILNVSVNHKQQRWMIIIMIVSTLVIIVIYIGIYMSALLMLGVKVDVTLSLIYCWYLVYKSLLFLQVIIIGFVIRERFRALNSLLR